VEIPDEEGAEILKMMVKLGAGLTIHNYYIETISETLSETAGLTSRENNNIFKTYLQEQLSN
jgi:undecaprenyl pyrophosphate phosphatase UppP